MDMKYCKHCGAQIDADCVVCPKCGKQVEELKAAKPDKSNNINVTAIASGPSKVAIGKQKRKWVAFFLCLFLGPLGAHRFYEGKKWTGILWLCTGGICGLGWLIDLILILFKPDPYIV